jgi:hypothetical protein
LNLSLLFFCCIAQSKHLQQKHVYALFGCWTNGAGP